VWPTQPGQDVLQIQGEGGGTVAGIDSTGTPFGNLAVGGGVSSFAELSGGINTSAAMTIGSGASLSATGTGTITATNIYAGSPNIDPRAFGISFDGKFYVGPFVNWTSGSTVVNAFSGTTVVAGEASVTNNVATLAPMIFPFNPIQQGWVMGQTIVVSGFTGGDTIYNGTFTISALTTNSISYLLTHANVSSSSNGFVVNSNVGPFKPSDTGKKAFGTNGAGGMISAVGASAIRPIGIVTYVSSTQITVAGNATQTCNTTACSFWWFTDDRALWMQVDAAVSGAPGCVTVELPSGVSPIPFGLFNSSSPVCGGYSGQNQVTQIDNGNNLKGQGSGASLLLLPPDSDFTKCVGADNSGGRTGCLFNAFASLQNFGVTGGGNGLTGTNNNTLVAPNQQANFTENLTLTDFGSGDLGLLVGITYPFSNKNDGNYVDQFGSYPCVMGGQTVLLSNSFCGDAKGISLSINGTTLAKTSRVYIGASVGTIGVNVSPGCTWDSSDDQSYGSVGSGGATIYAPSGSKIFIRNWATAGGAAYGLEMGATAIVYAQNSAFKGTTHCIGTGGVSLTSGAFFDQGGNSCITSPIEGTLVPTCGFTSGGGSSPSCALEAGSTNEKGTILLTTGSGSPGSTGTATLDFAGTFAGTIGGAPVCVYTLDDSGGTAWGNGALVRASTQSNTAPVLAWSNSVNNVLTALAAASTFSIGYSCIPR